MPRKKTATKKQNNERRLDNIHARKAAEKKYGKSKIKGKQVHHKDKEENSEQIRCKTSCILLQRCLDYSIVNKYNE